ncbi:DUF3892 domain-containing protein [Brevibacillus sp. SYSU BS000544]|uniref:DUF3892 domain-containing protein n=1 Tax=Brevibacillus sp. SYSU BS000544 TaxID=3416443 RepID=UPI003CE49736
MTEQNAPTVVAVRKNSDGNITKLKLSNGNEVDTLVAQQLVSQGLIANVEVLEGRDGGKHLRSIPDQDSSNNLDNLPEF